ncbi:hypothetical protein EDD86DRAFT_220212 [Gorgonomyces haynaldii]|nr:hypothetical protein EDD86DRAFT_220212 [Gorgonomyces haynaldii]
MESKISQLLSVLFTTGTILADFQEGSQPSLTNNLEKIRDLLLTLDKMADDIDIELPVEFVEMVEDGKNPRYEIYNHIRALVDKNQKTKGRVEAIEMFEKELSQHL